jgi:selenoprotein W-related protein
LAERIAWELRPHLKGEHPIKQIVLVPSGGGVFDVRANGEMIFSKKQAGRHAEAEEILAGIRGRLGTD